MNQARALGAALILLALGFNLPYARLAASFDYPDILRRPAGEVLASFAAGGGPLIATWYAYAFAAILLIGIAGAYGVHAQRQRHPAAGVVAVIGMFAGWTQAFGLLRWAFVVPMLAHVHEAAGPADVARQTSELLYETINRYGGVAIGEHLGQALTALWLLGVAGGQLQAGAGWRFAGGLALAGAVLIGIGCGNGLLLVLGQPLRVLDLATTAGFMSLSLWLLVTGAGLWRRPVPGPGLQ